MVPLIALPLRLASPRIATSPICIAHQVQSVNSFPGSFSFARAPTVPFSSFAFASPSLAAGFASPTLATIPTLSSCSFPLSLEVGVRCWALCADVPPAVTTEALYRLWADGRSRRELPGEMTISPASVTLAVTFAFALALAAHRVQVLIEHAVMLDVGPEYEGGTGGRLKAGANLLGCGLRMTK